MEAIEITQDRKEIFINFQTINSEIKIKRIMFVTSCCFRKERIIKSQR